MIPLIDNRLKKILQEYRDGRQYDQLLTELFNDCKYHHLYMICLERLYKIQYEKDIIIKPSLLLKIYEYDDKRLYKDSLVTGDKKEDYIHLVDGNQFKPGLIYNFLKRLGLSESRYALIQECIQDDPNLRIGQVKKYSGKQKRFEEIFEKELKQKYGEEMDSISL